MTKIKDIVMADDLLTSNIAHDEPDAFGLVDGRSWSELYDFRARMISNTIINALFDGEVVYDGFSTVFVPSNEIKYTAQETLDLMLDYHALLSSLEEHKANWLDSRWYDKQDNHLFAYKTLLELCFRVPVAVK